VGQSTEMHDLRQRHCPISTPTHCKKRVATAWLTHPAAAGYKWNAYGRITALLEDGIYSSAELSRSSALTLAVYSFLLVTQSRPARRALAAREMAL
jgi:hypothetical protein